MTGEEVLGFINAGEIMGIKIGMTVAEVYEKLGQPEELVGDSNVGYLEYGIISFGYFGNVIDELAIRFYKNKTIRFVTKETEFGEAGKIDGDTKINEFIYLLNSRSLLWDCYDKSNLDYFIVRSGVGVGIVFDLDDGNLNRISYAKNA